MQGLRDTDPAAFCPFISLSDESDRTRMSKFIVGKNGAA